jgi:poly-gamma-glutamate synthesis protein (capsule biosynthesis protein)
VGFVAEKKGTEYLFDGVSSVFQSDDLTVGNLESCVATCGSAVDKEFTFRASPDVLPGLVSSGIDAVSLANNHSLDFGRDAFLETLRHLRENGIPYCGAGRNIDEAYKPALLEAKGRSVALIGASRVIPFPDWWAKENRPGLAQAYQPVRLLDEVEHARSDADIVVVFLHWGVELAIMPEKYERELAHDLIDSGADLVIGSHPHILQGFEYYKGKLIAYSLGNFVFTNRDKNTVILQTVFVDGKFKSASIIPCRIRNYRPMVIEDTVMRDAVLEAEEGRSYGVEIDEDGALQKKGTGTFN